MFATYGKFVAALAVVALATTANVAAAAPVSYETRTVGYGGNRTMVVFAHKAPAADAARPYALTGRAASKLELRTVGFGGNRTSLVFVRVDR